MFCGTPIRLNHSLTQDEKMVMGRELEEKDRGVT